MTQDLEGGGVPHRPRGSLTQPTTPVLNEEGISANSSTEVAARQPGGGLSPAALGLNVPGDISVVGYDDSQPARLSYIDLTSVRQDAPRMAELAVEAIAERLDQGRTTDRDIVLRPTLVERGTASAPRS